jgi:DNA anti-recombination protein RmuC
MTAPLRSPCGDDCSHPSHRLTEQLTILEAQNARLKADNAFLEAANERLNNELEHIRTDWQKRLSQKEADQHAKHAPIKALFCGEGADLMPRKDIA